jgi:hypothetical protein
VGNFQNAFLNYLRLQHKEHFNISDEKPTCNRLESSKLIEIWVWYAFETNILNKNGDHKSNKNTFTNTETVKNCRMYHII